MDKGANCVEGSSSALNLGGGQDDNQNGAPSQEDKGNEDEVQLCWGSKEEIQDDGWKTVPGMFHMNHHCSNGISSDWGYSGPQHFGGCYLLQKDEPKSILAVEKLDTKGSECVKIEAVIHRKHR